jgi:sulfopropanediol 3-dehydrogenase
MHSQSIRICSSEKDDMAMSLEAGMTAEARADLDGSMPDTVEAALADIERRGDQAARGMSVKLDSWDRDDHRPSAREV